MSSVDGPPSVGVVHGGVGQRDIGEGERRVAVLDRSVHVGHRRGDADARRPRARRPSSRSASTGHCVNAAQARCKSAHELDELDAAKTDARGDVRCEAERAQEVRREALGCEQRREQEHDESEQHERMTVIVAPPPAAPDAERERNEQQRTEQRKRDDVVPLVRVSGEAGTCRWCGARAPGSCPATPTPTLNTDTDAARPKYPDASVIAVYDHRCGDHEERDARPTPRCDGARRIARGRARVSRAARESRARAATSGADTSRSRVRWRRPPIAAVARRAGRPSAAARRARAAPTGTVRMFRNPSRETAIIQSDPAVQRHREERRPATEATYGDVGRDHARRRRLAAAVPRSVSTDDRKTLNTAATMYA